MIKFCFFNANDSTKSALGWANVTANKKKHLLKNSSFFSKTGLKMLFNEDFYNVMELKIYSGYGSILPWIQSICNEELKESPDDTKN